MVATLINSQRLLDRLDRQIRLMERFDQGEYVKLSRLHGMLLANFPCDWSDEIEPGCTVVMCEREEFHILKRKELKFLELIAKETYGDDIIRPKQNTSSRVGPKVGVFGGVGWNVDTSTLRAGL